MLHCQQVRHLFFSMTVLLSTHGPSHLCYRKVMFAHQNILLFFVLYELLCDKDCSVYAHICLPRLTYTLYHELKSRLRHLTYFGLCATISVLGGSMAYLSGKSGEMTSPYVSQANNQQFCIVYWMFIDCRAGDCGLKVCFSRNSHTLSAKFC